MTPGVEVLPYHAPRSEWLAARRHGIGGSDIAPILGISSWTSPYAVWVSKIEALPDDNGSEAMRWGTILEAPIMDYLRADLDLDIRRQGLTRHADHEWARYSPDGILVEDDIPVGVAEIKTSLGPRARTYWDDGLPEYVWLQVQWGLEVLDLPGATVAALVTGPTLLRHDVERDEAVGRQLVDILGEWWERHVVGRQAPIVDAHPATTAILRRIPVRPSSTIDLDPATVLPILSERKAAHIAVKQALAWRDKLDNQLRAMLGEAEAGLIDGETVVTFKEQSRKESTSKATTFRKLSITGDYA